MVKVITITDVLLLALSAPPCQADVYKSVTESIRVGTRKVVVDTSVQPRIHDLGISGGFRDNRSNIPRLATLISAAQGGRNIVLSGDAIGNHGIPGRAYWSEQGVVMANHIGEGKAGEPCRVQAASYPVRPDIPVMWTLRLQLEGGESGSSWVLLPAGQDPVLLWQLKAPGLRPSLSMIADTDDTDNSKLMIYFSQLGGTASNVQRAGVIRGVKADAPIDVRISAVLDERDVAAGGLGRWHAWVNEHLVVDRVGPTLSSFANEPHQWFFGIYRYLTNCPSEVARHTRWETIRLEHGILKPSGEN